MPLRPGGLLSDHQPKETGVIRFTREWFERQTHTDQRVLPTRRATVVQLLHTLRVGGAEVLAARLARALGDQYRFVFACLDELGPLGAELRDEGFDVHVLERRAGVDWACSRSLARLLRRE